MRAPAGPARSPLASRREALAPPSRLRRVGQRLTASPRLPASLRAWPLLGHCGDRPRGALPTPYAGRPPGQARAAHTRLVAPPAHGTPGSRVRTRERRSRSLRLEAGEGRSRLKALSPARCQKAVLLQAAAIYLPVRVLRYCTVILYCDTVLQYCTVILYCDAILSFCDAAISSNNRAPGDLQGPWLRYPARPLAPGLAATGPLPSRRRCPLPRAHGDEQTAAPRRAARRGVQRHAGTKNKRHAGTKGCRGRRWERRVRFLPREGKERLVPRDGGGNWPRCT